MGYYYWRMGRSKKVVENWSFCRERKCYVVFMSDGSRLSFGSMKAMLESPEGLLRQMYEIGQSMPAPADVMQRLIKRLKERFDPEEEEEEVSDISDWSFNPSSRSLIVEYSNGERRAFLIDVLLNIRVNNLVCMQKLLKVPSRKHFVNVEQLFRDRITQLQQQQQHSLPDDQPEPSLSTYHNDADTLVD